MQDVWLYVFAGHTDGFLADSADFLVYLVFKQRPGLHLSVFCCFLQYRIWKRQN